MKKLILTLFALAIMAAPAVSSASPNRVGPYISGFIGVTIPADADAGFFNEEIEFDPGFNVGGTAGMDYGTLRVEGEISYKEADVDSITDRGTGETFRGIEGGIEATAFMVNLFVDLHSPGPITPYFGGGVGFAALHQSETFDDLGTFYFADDEMVFAYQAGAGLEIALNRQVSLDLAYRFFRTSEATFTDTEMEFESHNATVGLRLKY